MLQNPRHYPVTTYWSPEDQEYVAISSDWPGLTAFNANSPTAAQKQMYALIEEAMSIHERNGYPIPEPSDPNDSSAVIPLHRAREAAKAQRRRTKYSHERF